MLKKIFLKLINCTLFILFFTNILLLSTAVLANNALHNAATNSSSNQVMQMPEIAPNVSLSLNAKDQEDLSKLFGNARYEDFITQKPLVNFSIGKSR